MAAPSHWEKGALAVFVVAFSLAFGPFFNGMFYEPIRLLGVALFCVAGWLAFVRLRERPLHVADWLPLLLFGTYAVASATAIFPRGQLSVLLDLTAFLAVYATARTHPQHSGSLVRILVVAGAFMAAISISRLYGVTFWDQFVIDLVVYWRLSGGFQYPNTFAAWLGALWFLSLGEVRRSRIAPAYLALGGLFAGAFMLTQSRGALLALPVAFLGALLTARPGDRLFLVLAALLTWVPAFFLGNGAVAALLRGSPSHSLLLVLSCLLPPLAVPAVCRGFHLLGRASRSVRIGLAAGLSSSLALVGLWAAPRLQPLLGSFLAQVADTRLTEGYTLSDRSILSRLVFSQDAWRIMEDLGFLGAGGRAWQRLYLAIRTYPYFTTEVHNHYLQVGVEAGLAGLVTFTAMIAVILFRAWRARHAQQEGDLTLPAWAGAVAFIAAHSLYDFDLSYLSLLILLAAGLGVLAAQSDSPRVLPAHLSAWWRRSILGLSMLAFVTSGSLLLSWWATVDSDRAWAAGDPARAAARLRLARWTDPLDPEVWLRTAALKKATGEWEAARDEIVAALERARELDPYTPDVHVQLADAAFAEGRWDDGLDHVLRAQQLHPLDPGLIESAADLVWQRAMALLQAGDQEHAVATARRLVPIGAQLEEELARITELGVRSDYPYGYTPNAHLRMGQALLLAGGFEQAESHLREALKAKHLTDEATRWLSVALELRGRTAEAEQLRQERPELFTEFLEGETYRLVREAAATQN